MLEGIYVLTHGGVVPGQERLVAPLYQNALEIWRGKTGVTQMGGFMLTPGSGPRDHMAFMSMYRGRLEDLNRIILSEEYERFWAVAAQVLKNLSGRLYGGGSREEFERIMAGAGAVWREQGFIK